MNVLKPSVSLNVTKIVVKADAPVMRSEASECCAPVASVVGISKKPVASNCCPTGSSNAD